MQLPTTGSALMKMSARGLGPAHVRLGCGLRIGEELSRSFDGSFERKFSNGARPGTRERALF
jgi:hypothetical protein